VAANELGLPALAAEDATSERKRPKFDRSSVQEFLAKKICSRIHQASEGLNYGHGLVPAARRPSCLQQAGKVGRRPPVSLKALAVSRPVEG
jgi:hypothetical protein